MPSWEKYMDGLEIIEIGKAKDKRPKCPECEVELTEYEGQFVCEICGFIDGETPEDRYAREKAYKEKIKSQIGMY